MAKDGVCVAGRGSYVTNCIFVLEVEKNNNPELGSDQRSVGKLGRRREHFVAGGVFLLTQEQRCFLNALI